MRRRISDVFVAAAGGAPVSLRSGRGPRIIVAMHERDCSECAAYVTRLARRKTALEEWGARVSAVAERRPHGAVSDRLRDGQVELLLCDDPPAALGVTPPAVIVTDEWGEVFFSVPAGAGHDFPDPDEMIEWTRFIAIQCPECGQAEGEWRSVG